MTPEDELLALYVARLLHYYDRIVRLCAERERDTMARRRQRPRRRTRRV